MIIPILKVQDYTHFGASGPDGNVGGNVDGNVDGNCVATVLPVNVVS